jgi:hypothetical protein
MRRAAWLVLVGAVCVGCGRKQEVAVPDVRLDPNAERVTVPFQTTQPPPFELPYGKLWDPKGAEKADPAVAVKTFLAQRYFAKHQTEFLAPATVGTTVSLAQGGWHGVVVPVALAGAYPDAARKFESKESLAVTTTNFGTPQLDFSTHGGAVASRVLVFRVKAGTDDELQTRFDEYLERVESAVQGTGATIVSQRGGGRATGALSDIRYEVADHIGNVRSVVVREFDDADAEFADMFLSDAGKGNGDLLKATMNAKNGPYLVVALRDERR